MFTIENALNPYDFTLPEISTPNTVIKYIIYSVNTSTRVPYTIFYLKNENNILSFPTWENDGEPPKSVDDVISNIRAIMWESSTYISDITPEGYVIGQSPFSKLSKTIYMVYKLQITNDEPIYLNNMYSIWPVLFWEIFNTGHVIHKIIDVEIPMVFRSHMTLVGVPDSDTSSNIYPIVGYSVHPEKNIGFYAMFGTPRDDTGSVGPYFYYYRNVANMDKAIQTHPFRNGYIRYVIFATHIVADEETFKKDTHCNTVATIGPYIVSDSSELAKPISYHIDTSTYQ